MGPEKAILLRVRVFLGIIAMKEHSILTESPELEPHHQIQFNVIPMIYLFGG